MCSILKESFVKYLDFNEDAAEYAHGFAKDSVDFSDGIIGDANELTKDYILYSTIFTEKMLGKQKNQTYRNLYFTSIFM